MYGKTPKWVHSQNKGLNTKRGRFCLLKWEGYRQCVHLFTLTKRVNNVSSFIGRIFIGAHEYTKKTYQRAFTSRLMPKEWGILEINICLRQNQRGLFQKHLPPRALPNLKHW